MFDFDDVFSFHAYPNPHKTHFYSLFHSATIQFQSHSICTCCTPWSYSQSVGEDRRVYPLRYCGVAVPVPPELLKHRGTIIIKIIRIIIKIPSAFL